MATIYRIKERKAEKLFEHAMKLYKEAKKLKECVEELTDEGSDEDFNERMGSGNGNYRDEDDDDMDFNERRGVPGTGRYGRSYYRRR